MPGYSLSIGYWNHPFPQANRTSAYGQVWLPGQPLLKIRFSGQVEFEFPQVNHFVGHQLKVKLHGDQLQKVLLRFAYTPRRYYRRYYLVFSNRSFAFWALFQKTVQIEEFMLDLPNSSIWNFLQCLFGLIFFWPKCVGAFHGEQLYKKPICWMRIPLSVNVSEIFGNNCIQLSWGSINIGATWRTFHPFLTHSNRRM